ncbi:MAG: hypothetical protein LBV04_00895 [Deferribacteraceae bacterium]|jgi:hypothetical protein|nr:hypothetical protein [Deferribacteraceae bacterium]
MSELQDIHAGREVLYSLFYRVFIMTPESDLYTMLAELLSFMRQTAEGDEAAETAISKIEQFFIERERCAARKLNSSKAEFDLETQRRYTRLFCMTNSVRSCQSHYESENRLSRDEAYSQCL